MLHPAPVTHQAKNNLAEIHLAFANRPKAFQLDPIPVVLLQGRRQRAVFRREHGAQNRSLEAAAEHCGDPQRPLGAGRRVDTAAGRHTDRTGQHQC